jgi:hypothetical protein
MKTFAMCGIVGALAFMIMGYQTGLFEDAPLSAEVPVANEEKIAKEEKKAAPPKARFPQDLARLVRQQPVAQAAGFNPTNKTHRLVILKPSGALHSWQEDIKEEWQAETVEQTELAVVVAPQTKTRVSRHTYPNGAPPIERFQWDLNAYIVDAKSGQVLATRRFQNIPRGLKEIEAWELTSIGQPVSFRSVFNWVASMSRSGFPQEDTDLPLVTVVE